MWYKYCTISLIKTLLGNITKSIKLRSQITCRSSDIWCAVNKSLKVIFMLQKWHNWYVLSVRCNHPAEWVDLCKSQPLADFSLPSGKCVTVTGFVSLSHVIKIKKKKTCSVLYLFSFCVWIEAKCEFLIINFLTKNRWKYFWTFCQLYVRL